MPALEELTVFFPKKYYSVSFGDLANIINRIIWGVHMGLGIEFLSTVIRREIIHTI